MYCTADYYFHSQVSTVLSTESEAPLNLTAVPTNTTVTVSWMAPQDPNGIIFTYSVILLDESSLEVDRMNTSGGMLSVEFSDLDPFSNYTVSVRALTGESGEFVGESATTSFTTLQGSKESCSFLLIHLLSHPQSTPCS